MSAPFLEPLSADAVSGTGTLDLDGDLLGGIYVNTDGSNAATVEIRDEDDAGAILASISGPNPAPMIGPIRAPSGSVYYSISGTNVTAMLYEWRYHTAPLGD